MGAQPDSQGSEPPPPPLAELWSGFTRDPGAGTAVVSHEGVVEYLNKQAARMLVGDDADAANIVGKSITEIAPAAWASERLEILEQVRRTRRPALLRSIWEGRQQLTWVHPISKDTAEAFDEFNLHDDEVDHYLVVTRRATGDLEELAPEETWYDRVETEVIHLGQLSALTVRQLEVLALIGQGLSTKEMARVLHRSEKTIENHRSSIGAKLDAGDRVRLAEIAQRAGLQIDDAMRTDIGPSHALESRSE